MPRYIDAEEFIEDIKAENTNLMMDGLKGTPHRMALSAKDVIERINEIPTADVQEVKHAHWITNFSSTKLLCSNCKCGRRHQAYLNGSYEHLPPFPKYCENCGARMKGE